MNRCEICGKHEVLPYVCSYCGGVYCSDHRLPEYHNCAGLEAGIVKSPVEKRRIEEDYSVPVKRKRRISSGKLRVVSYGYTNLILGVIAVVFFLQLVIPYFIPLFYFDPANIARKPWGIVTSIFLHGGLNHFLINFIVLLFFGNELERRIGGKNFLKIFFLSGIAGNLGYLTYSVLTGDPTPALGASGAIYGVFATLAVIAPEVRVLVFLFIPLSIRTALILFAIYDIVFLPLSSVTGIASAAHLTGLVVGLYYGRRLRKKPPSYGMVLYPF